MTKTRLLKFLASFILIVVFIGCAAMLANPNNYKNFIADVFNRETGYQLHLTGDIELSWWPNITGLINNISVGNSSDDKTWFIAKKLSVSTDSAQLVKNHGVPHVVQLSATDGVLNGFDVVGILNVLERIIECKCLLPIPSSGETRFETLTAKVFMQNQVYSNQDLYIQGSGFTLTGKGTLADIKKSSVDYDLILYVEARSEQSQSQNSNLGNYTIAIHCYGDLSGPTCTPDLSTIVEQIIKKDSKKKLKKLEKKIKKEAEKFLKGLLQL
ncbi:MAG: hypothetical protein ACKVJV_02555 [Gammaproteobacteria bacterium]|jgi:hypothetical protein